MNPSGSDEDFAFTFTEIQRNPYNKTKGRAIAIKFSHYLLEQILAFEVAHNSEY